MIHGTRIKTSEALYPLNYNSSLVTYFIICSFLGLSSYLQPLLLTHGIIQSKMNVHTSVSAQSIMVSTVTKFISSDSPAFLSSSCSQKIKR